MHFHVRSLFISLSFWFFAWSAQAVTLSQVYGTDLTKQTQTFFLRGEAGWTTYESQAAASNGTGSSASMTIGGFAGENRLLGVFMTAHDVTMPFELNRSNVRRSVRDLRMQARLAFVYPSIIVSQTDTKVSLDAVSESEAAALSLSPREESVVCDVFGNSVGAGLGIHAAMTEKIVVHADVAMLQGSSASDRDGKRVQLGQRQDIQVGANVDVTKDMVDLVMGYRVQNFDFTVDDVKFEEKMTTPYAGLQLGVYF
jgi:hypothetical protein